MAEQINIFKRVFLKTKFSKTRKLNNSVNFHLIYLKFCIVVSDTISFGCTLGIFNRVISYYVFLKKILIEIFFSKYHYFIINLSKE